MSEFKMASSCSTQTMKKQDSSWRRWKCSSVLWFVVVLVLVQCCEGKQMSETLQRALSAVRGPSPGAKKLLNIPEDGECDSDAAVGDDDYRDDEYPQYIRYYEEPVDLTEIGDISDACAPPTAASPAPPPPPAPQPPAAVAPSAADGTAPPPAAASLPLTTTETAAPQITSQLQEPVPELDPYLSEILGEDPTSTREYSDDIQKDLAVRLNHIATTGLSKEDRKAIKEKYLVPSNCKLIKAPTLNPEIRASLVESQAKRDKGIEGKQNMTTCALSSLSAAITLLLASEYKNPELLKMLMDTARILGDMQHSDSVLRRFFILSTVKKELKDQLEKTKIDETLFGNNLPETLKSAKTISKSGADIRSASNSLRPTAPKSTVRAPANKPLNYRAPPAGRRPPPPGGAGGRTARAPPAPAPRQTMRTATSHSASRMSSRQHNPRYRR